MDNSGHGPKAKPLRAGTQPRRHVLWAHIGQRLRQRRTQLGLQAGDVAGKLEISPDIYAEYEAGRLQTPALLLSDIAQLFNLPVTWFFQDLSSDSGGEPDGGEGVFAVATDEERIEALTDYFRSLDLEGQQHLLQVARTLSQSRKGAKAD